MTNTVKIPKTRTPRIDPQGSCTVSKTISSPDLKLPKLWGNFKSKEHLEACSTKITSKEGAIASESNLPNRQQDALHIKRKSGQGDERVPGASGVYGAVNMNEGHLKTLSKHLKRCEKPGRGDVIPKEKKCILIVSWSGSPSIACLNEPVTKKIHAIHNKTRKSARIFLDSRRRLQEIQKKPILTKVELKEMNEQNELLLHEMDKIDQYTKMLKSLSVQLTEFNKRKVGDDPLCSVSDSDLDECAGVSKRSMFKCDEYRAMDLQSQKPCIDNLKGNELNLTRKLNESYDMQEKLVADNVDLDNRRLVLTKELLSKDNHLEQCRAQLQRTQGKIKLLEKENSALQDKLTKNHPQGDATPVREDTSVQSSCDVRKIEVDKLFGEIEDVRSVMASIKDQGSACRGGGGVNTCFAQPADGPPVPPMTKATPAEREVQKLTIQLRQTEENFKKKVVECAMLRADVLRKKEELEKERCQHREVQNKLRELEMKFEGLTTTTNMALGSKEQAFEQEVNVRALKQCYREAREEIDELRVLMKEQNDQLQDYRTKYLQVQQLVEEQRRQMDVMDMDNTRISEQINLEIQKVKLKFQEKLQELAPIPDLLKATQMKLKDAQQSQAIAEHNAEQLARELNCAREKVHVLLHNSLKPPEKPTERSGDEKQIALLQQRITQLTESNITLKSEIERLKANVIRMEEGVLANEKRLQEKMHECAQIGGELDRARDEAARALQRANERTETIRKCMQTTVAELERQLASTRAQVKVAEKEREEIQSRMTCQIKRLNENFEQAQLRILGLQTQVQTLRRTASSTGEGEGDTDAQQCLCATFFDNP
ncbi:unnamed protein product [Leptosia nina]|uniref:Outer dense fiber protein 2 n=1 Tax=Leptosia nina TaxID=320188 RepID=A0AAV1JZ00_9NEOP